MQPSTHTTSDYLHAPRIRAQKHLRLRNLDSRPIAVASSMKDLAVAVNGIFPVTRRFNQMNIKNRPVSLSQTSSRGRVCTSQLHGQRDGLTQSLLQRPLIC